MIKKPVAIIVGLILLLAGLFRCDAFSAAHATTIPNVTIVSCYEASTYSHQSFVFVLLSQANQE